MATTEELDAGRNVLQAAIQEYLELKYPGSYLEHFIVIMEQSNLQDPSEDSITYEEDAGNTWINRRGMLETATQHVREVQSAQYRRHYDD